MNRERVIPLTIRSSQLIQTAPRGPTAKGGKAPASARNFPHSKKRKRKIQPFIFFLVLRYDAAVTAEASEFSPTDFLFIAPRRGQRRPDSAPSNTAAFLRAIGEPAAS